MEGDSDDYEAVAKLIATQRKAGSKAIDSKGGYEGENSSSFFG